MNTHRQQRLPASLSVVAILTILGGISSVINVVGSLIHGYLNIDFGILGIFIGIGLLRLSQGWRTCALVFTWIGLIACPIIELLFLGHTGPLDFNVFGQKVGNAPKELGVALVILVFCYSMWQLHVLTRSDVRALFSNHTR